MWVLNKFGEWVFVESESKAKLGKAFQRKTLSKHFIHGEGEGGGGGGEEKVSKAEYEKLKGEFESLSNKNKELLTDISSTKSKLKDWEGLDPKQVRSLMERMKNDEELRLISEGKHDEVINKRVEKVQLEYEEKITNLGKERETLHQDATKYKNKYQQYRLNSELSREFVTNGGLETALDDIILRASSVFGLDDDDNIVAFEKDGKIRKNKDGGVFTLKDFILDQVEKAPHLFKESVGGNSSSNERGTTLSGIDAKMADASKRGDVAEYRRLKRVKEEQRKKQE